ncbi:MAG: hypothetical protein K2X98_00765 [Alphaproteobacteria bacterium]|nr:hypothetical protein [Alphaproteobacteria bacterium]
MTLYPSERKNIDQHLLAIDDPLLKVVPSLKQAMMSHLTLKNHHNNNDGGLDHEHALMACFHVLCVLDKNPKKPQYRNDSHPRQYVLENIIEDIATRCSYGAREINLHKMDFSKDAWPCIVFDAKTDSPKLIFYKKEVAYLYDPWTQRSQRMKTKNVRTLHPLAYTLYKQINATSASKALSVSDLAKSAYGETKSDVKQYLFLQAMIALLTLFQPVLSGMIFDDVLALRQISFMQEIFLGIFVVSMTSILFRYLQIKAMTRLHIKSTRFIQSAVWQRLLAFHLRFFRTLRLGDIHERASSI